MGPFGTPSALRAALPLSLLAAVAALGCGDARPAAGTPSDPCTACHGDPSRPATPLNPRLPSAPPTDTRGQSSPSSPGVGSHQIHLVDGHIARAVACVNCHAVPSDLRHATSGAPVVAFAPGTLATAGGASPTWAAGSLTCSATYCHGSFDYGGVTGNAGPTPPWTSDPAHACTSCHGTPPPPPHPQNGVSDCGGCHPGYTSSTVDLDLHLNGRPDLGGGGAGCAACHGYPPATGAHAVHVGAPDDPATARYGETSILQDLLPSATPATAPQAYFFGCGNCHPLDPSRHMDGAVEVELFDPAAPAGSLKARSPAGAAYAKAPGDAYGSCGNVYCHSSGQETPGFYRTTPRWDLAFGPAAKDGCTGCHDNPPRQPSGGAGTATANQHLVMAGDGYESGHFGGFPSAWHGGSHGSTSPGAGAAAITCQTCHFDTTDPGNTGPSGFYYLDTTGDYRLPGGLLGYDCSSCHRPGGAPQGTGKVLPLRHVNGTRDVVFDPRTALPPYPGLPAAPNAPSRPYWTALAGLSPAGFPPDMGYDGTTLSVSVARSSYDPLAKSCSSVSCHMAQSPVVWGGPEDFTSALCGSCHPR